MYAKSEHSSPPFHHYHHCWPTPPSLSPGLLQLSASLVFFVHHSSLYTCCPHSSQMIILKQGQIVPCLCSKPSNVLQRHSEWNPKFLPWLTRLHLSDLQQRGSLGSIYQLPEEGGAFWVTAMGNCHWHVVGKERPQICWASWSYRTAPQNKEISHTLQKFQMSAFEIARKAILELSGTESNFIFYI